MKYILGKKLNMTRIFSDDSRAWAVTKVHAGPCFVTGLKTKDRDGYEAVQIGFSETKRLNKPLTGRLKKLPKVKHLQEFRIDNTQDIKVGQEIDLASFQVGDKLKVTGISKGKGFQGVVKRHGFHGSPASHGHKDQLRMPGSIGATDAARVFKGRKMPGQMGNQKVTVANLEIMKIEPENNLIYLKGAVPGARGSLISLQTAGDIKFKSAQTAAAETKPEEKADADKSKVKETKPEEKVETKETDSQKSDSKK